MSLHWVLWILEGIFFKEQFGSVLLYVHRNLLVTGSPGRPPRLSYSSCALTCSALLRCYALGYACWCKYGRRANAVTFFLFVSDWRVNALKCYYFSDWLKLLLKSRMTDIPEISTVCVSSYQTVAGHTLRVVKWRWGTQNSMLVGLFVRVFVLLRNP